jgi:hypothetical protein
MFCVTSVSSDVEQPSRTLAGTAGREYESYGGLHL